MNRLAWIFACLPLVAMVGCGSSEPPTTVAPSPARDDLTADTAAPPALDLLESLQEPSVESTLVSVEEAPLQEPLDFKDYTPPFPDRIDLFSPPQYFGDRTSGERNEDSGSVVLLGFAELDTPKAVLQINGSVTALAQGEENFGVQVISISSPQAVLQRGRTRWTATID